MSFRMFIGLQLLMFLVLGLVTPQLLEIEQIRAGVVLNFAVFYLMGMLVGYKVTDSPLANALVVGFVFNLVFYLIVFIAGDVKSITKGAVITDILTTIVFSTLGTMVGLRSRPTGNENPTEE